MAKNVTIKEKNNVNLNVAKVWDNPTYLGRNDNGERMWRFTITCPWQNKSTTGEGGLAYDAINYYCLNETKIAIEQHFIKEGLELHVNEKKEDREAAGRKAQNITIYKLIGVANSKEQHWQDKKKWNLNLMEFNAHFHFSEPKSSSVALAAMAHSEFDLF